MRVVFGPPAHCALWWAGIVLLVAGHLALGFSRIPSAVYASQAAVAGEFLNGPVRLLLPIAASLIAASWAVRELNHRYIAYTRSRVSVRRYLVERISIAIGVVFLIFFTVGILSVLAGYVVAPAIWPEAVDPAGYGLNGPDEAQSSDAQQSPLTPLLQYGQVVYFVGVGAWLGVNAAVFGLVGIVAVFLTTKPILALSVPFLIYIAESVVLQVLAMPAPSFLVLAVYPTGLQDYPLYQAVLPTALLAVAGLAATMWIIKEAPTMSRLS